MNMTTGWNAEDYYKSSSEQKKWAVELLKKLELKGNERILDIGCGDGKIAAEIATRVPHGYVVGIDSSEDMVRFAAGTFPPDQFPNLSFQRLDAGKLNFDGGFDVVVSFACLHWVKNHLPVLQGIRRSLVPSGRILLQFGGRGNAAGIQEVTSRVAEREQWKQFFPEIPFPWGLYGPEEYSQWLKQAGFRTSRIELLPKDMAHKGLEGFKAWVRTTHALPYLQKIPEDLKPEFLDEVVRAYVEEYPPDEKDLVHVQMVRLEVEAQNVN